MSKQIPIMTPGLVLLLSTLGAGCPTPLPEPIVPIAAQQDAKSRSEQAGASDDEEAEREAAKSSAETGEPPAPETQR